MTGKVNKNKYYTYVVYKAQHSFDKYEKRKENEKLKKRTSSKTPLKRF